MVAALVCLLDSCAKKSVTESRPAFCADSAYSYIERQMAFGPRVPNSAAHMQCAVWLIEQLRASGKDFKFICFHRHRLLAFSC